jgi:hypothetical protein
MLVLVEALVCRFLILNHKPRLLYMVGVAEAAEVEEEVAAVVKVEVVLRFCIYLYV